MSSLEKHDVINLIKSCLLSVQGSISINKLDDDYLLLEGTRIPFKKFGSTSLEYFLKTIPEIEFTRNRFGHTLVNARPSKSTEHIASFVAKQKPKHRSRHGNVYLHNHMKTSIPSGGYIKEHSFRSKTEHVQSNFEVPQKFRKDVLSPLQNEQPEKLSAKVETSIPEKPLDKLSIATKVSPSNKILKSSSNLPERTNVSLKNHNNKFLAPSQKTDLEENMLDDTYTNSTIISPLTPLRARLLASSKKQAPILQVNNFRKPTFPMEYKPSGEVLQIAAKQPFEDFRKLPQTLRNSMSVHSIKEFVDDQSITMNIIKLLNSFPYGIWAENLPHFYKKTFGETLPENWGLVIKVNPRIKIEEPVPGKSIIFLSTEISPKSLSSNLDEISLQQLVPPPLILPDTAEWDVYITVVTPNANIYVRLLGEDYSIIYENMATDMELYYMNTIAVVDNPIVGNYYAIKLDDCWHRVLVQEIQEQQAGRLFFIDQGDEEWHPLSSLCHLEPKFAQIPAQAVLCRLHGLEEFIHHPLTCGILTSLVVGKSMIARLIPQASENDQAVSVIVFDTHTDDDVNINFLLAESITHSVSHHFDLPVEKPCNVVITNILNDSTLYVQNQGESFQLLQAFIKLLIHTGHDSRNIITGIKMLDSTKLYLYKDLKDMQWYRVSIDLKDQSEVPIFYVDYGISSYATPMDLILLEPLSSVLSMFPSQAIKVALKDVTATAAMTSVFKRLVTKKETVILKRLDNEDCGLPVVEIHQILNGSPTSLNTSIAFNERKCKSLLSPVEALTYEMSNIAVQQKKQSEVPHQSLTLGLDKTTSQANLPYPKIPEIGTYYDVKVCLAAHPQNFVVQPLEYKWQFSAMMESMQNFYNSSALLSPTVNNITPGKLYAALHTDGVWYRVKFITMVKDNVVLIHFCDFGDFVQLSINDLKPLFGHFQTLPSQALKAKLSFVKPCHCDWSTEDGVIFQNMVLDREFVALVHEITKDDHDSNETILGLSLIDTSNSKDLIIGNILVQEGRAIIS